MKERVVKRKRFIKNVFKREQERGTDREIEAHLWMRYRYIFHIRSTRVR